MYTKCTASKASSYTRKVCGSGNIPVSRMPKKARASSVHFTIASIVVFQKKFHVEEEKKGFVCSIARAGSLTEGENESVEIRVEGESRERSVKI